MTTKERTSTRTMTRSDWTEEPLAGGGRLLIYEVAGTGFLKYMVRAIVGTLVEVGDGRRSPASLGDLLDSRDRAAAGPTAPPSGLYLVRVDYDAAGPVSFSDEHVSRTAAGNDSERISRRKPRPRGEFRRAPVAHRHHHGRQRPLGGAAPSCRASKGIARASKSVRDAVETSARLGIGALTLYAFSVENWKRPVTEVTALMTLLKRYLRLELDAINRNNIRFQVIGRTDELSARRAAGARGRPGSDRAQYRHAVQHRAELRRPRGNRRRGAPRDSGGRACRRSRRAEVCRIPLHSGPAGSRSADPHERRNARQQLSAVADRVRRDLGHRYALARLPPPPSARSGARVSKTRSPLRRHQAHAGTVTL